MSASFKQVIENIENLTPDEKALIAHCLISSLEARQDDSVDEAWGALAQKRLVELKSGTVASVSWDKIKSKIKE